MIKDFNRKPHGRARQVWAYLPIAIAAIIVAPTASPAAPAKSKPQPPAKTPPPSATAPAASKPASKAKVQVIVLAKPGTTKDGLKESLDAVSGTVVSSTTDGTNTFYLIELDQDSSAESIKTLSKDKNFRSVSINRRIHQLGN